MKFMIRNTESGMYSCGIISKGYGISSVNWHPKRGKVWTKEKYLKEHILNYALQCGTADFDKWAVVEIVEQPTKPINEWMDASMTLKLLKKVPT